MLKTYEEAIEEMGEKLKAIRYWEARWSKQDVEEWYTELRGVMELLGFLTGKDYVEVDADVRWAADSMECKEGTAI